MKNMTVPQLIVYVFAVLVLLAIFVKLTNTYVTIPVVNQIAQAVADMLTGASK